MGVSVVVVSTVVVLVSSEFALREQEQVQYNDREGRIHYWLDSLEVIMEQRMDRKVQQCYAKSSNVLCVCSELKSSFSDRLVMPRSSSERLRKFLVPAAVKCFNEQRC